jgi:hypothetical protein
LQDIGTEDTKTCWRVEATDSISVPGILEITAVEYYANEDEDDIKNGVVGGLIEEQENPNTNQEENTIKGETFIKPRKQYEYVYRGNKKGEWSYDSETPIEVEIKGKNIKIKWLSTYSGQFDLYYGE